MSQTVASAHRHQVDGPRASFGAKIVVVGLSALVCAITASLVIPRQVDAFPRKVIGRGALTTPGEIQDSIPGREVAALDPRTGVPLHLAARRVLATGTLDESWEPDSAFALRAALGGYLRSSQEQRGERLVVWAEEREWAGRIRLKRFGGDGVSTEGWPHDGVIVSSGQGSRYAPAVSGDGSGGAYVAWTDYRTGLPRVRVQRIEADGALTPNWPEGSAVVSAVASEQANARVIADGTEGVHVVWEDRRSGVIRLYAQRLDAAGEIAPGWPVEGLLLDTLGTFTLAAEVFPIRDLGTLVTWERGTEATGIDLVAAFAPTGQSWPAAFAAPVVLSSGAGAYGEVAALEQGDESVAVIWSEWRGSSASLRAQKLRLATLEPSWMPGGVMIREGEVSRAPPAVTTLNDTALAVAVQGFSTPLESDIFVHAVGPDGAPPAGWPAAGLATCVARHDQHHPTVVSDSAGGALVSWLDSRPISSANAPVRAVSIRPPIELISAHATPGRAQIVWRSTQRLEGQFSAMRRVAEGEWEVIAAPAADDSARLALDDRTVPDGVHAEYRLTLKGPRVELHSGVVALEIPSAPRVLTLHRVRSLGREQALLVSFALPRGDVPRLDLLDVQGRRVFEQRLEGLEPGEHQYHWRLPNRVASGVYFLRLLQAGVERTAKVSFIR